ncbi:MAG: extracellular solute-binding protein [Candidatus Kapaibacteriales bacterium]
MVYKMINKCYSYSFILLLIAFVSCQEDKSESIEFWTFLSEPNQFEALNSQINKFEESTGIDVNVTRLSWADGKTKIIAGFNSGTGPDILEVGSDWVSQFASQDIFDTLVIGSISDSYFEYTLEAGTHKDVLYAIPWYIDSRPVFLNLDLLSRYYEENSMFLQDTISFEHFYRTIYWKQLLDINHKIDGKYLIGVNGPDRHRLYKKVLPMIWSAGGSIFQDGSFGFQSPIVEEIYEFYASLSKTNLVESQKNLDNEFLKGNIAILNSGSWLLGKLQNQNSFKFTTVEMFGFNKSDKGVAFAGGEYLAVNSQSIKKDKAKLLLEFLTIDDTVLALADSISSFGFPATKAGLNSSIEKAQGQKRVFAKQLENSKMTPASEYWLQIEPLFEESIEQVIYNKLTAKQALTKLEKEIKNVQD